MGAVFKVRCNDDEEDGPELQRAAGGTSLLEPDAWSAFLIEHTHHDLSLVWTS